MGQNQKKWASTFYGTELVGEALPYENIKRIWVAGECFAMQCESGELCYSKNYADAVIQKSADVFAPLPSIKGKYLFGENIDIHFISHANTFNTEYASCLVWRKKGDTRFFALSYFEPNPVAQAMGQGFNYSYLAYDYAFSHTGFTPENCLQMRCVAHASSDFNMYWVIKNKESGKDDLYHWINGKGFVKIAY